jgi:uncharacterized protein (TIGR00369 family)
MLCEVTMSDYTPANPNFEAFVRGSFRRQGFMAHLGAELTQVAPGRTEIRVPFDPRLSQQHGFFHGGVMASIADVAAGYAGNSLMAVEDSVLTVEFKINIVAPGEGEELVARGHVIRPGRTLTVTRADVFVVKGGREKLCATALQTLMRMAGKAERSDEGQA